MFIFYRRRKRYGFNFFRCDKLSCCCTILSGSLFAVVRVLLSILHICSYFIIDMSAMDLTSFRVTNYVAAAPYVLAVCLKLYISFRPFSIYRVFRFYRRECYGINVLPSDKLSYCCTISCACMFALTDITVFSIINFPSGISRCDDKVFLVTNAECTILRHEITLRLFSCCGVILS